jgi:hypothetical protein
VPNAKFREAVVMGEFKGTSRDLDQILNELRPQFGGNDYNVLQRNCNCFSEALVWKLCRKQVPTYVNRMANFGSYFSCLLPPSLTGDAPVDSGSGQSTSSGYTVSGPKSYQSGASSSFTGKGHKLGGTV